MPKSKLIATPPETTISGGPTKRLFVEMLTRDIGLRGAILDLVDNSIDGAMRIKKNKLDSSKPFSGLHTAITITPTRFEINDNCGGIGEANLKSAFSLGRSDILQDSDIPTIGMYGIGMKRAIFKIGGSAKVESNSKDGHFTVEYSKAWLDPENDVWDLPINKTKKKLAQTVSVSELVI